MRLWQELRAARTWNSTLGERQLGYPCDKLVPLVDESYYRAVDVNAPARTLYRWLCQLRFGPYSYAVIDRFGGNSPDALTPGAEDLASGQPLMRHFRLAEFEPDHHLTLQLATEADRWGTVAITYSVVPQPGQTCRLVAKSMFQRPAGGIGRLLAWVQPYVNFVLMRKQLLRLKLLAEHDRARELAAGSR